MKILVTGAAGFIGSHLCEQLLQTQGTEVIGVDCFIGPTPIALKQENVRKLQQMNRFKLVNADLLTADLDHLLEGVDVIYHLAAIPGVRSSWGSDFHPYVTNNILATQRLLEAVKDQPLRKFIYASTSSVYGDKSGKVRENDALSPISPYGITKLTGEQLCRVYQQSYGLPLVIVRFFTVYGPRQRPDMAFHRFMLQFLKGEPLTIFGDGNQSRDYTYISDCVSATAAILTTDCTGQTMNFGGTERATVNEVIAIMEEVTGVKAQLQYLPKLKGEPFHTWADTSLANQLLRYAPKVSLKEGMAEELEYILYVYCL